MSHFEMRDGAMTLVKDQPYQVGFAQGVSASPDHTACHRQIEALTDELKEVNRKLLEAEDKMKRAESTFEEQKALIDKQAAQIERLKNKQ